MQDNLKLHVMVSFCGIQSYREYVAEKEWLLRSVLECRGSHAVSRGKSSGVEEP
jgi:hypothetical protein